MVKDFRKEEFILLINQHENVIHKVCNIYADTSPDKEDLKQEIIFQLWKSYPSFRKEAKIQTWMYKVALNTALIGLRRKKRVVKTTELENHPDVLDHDDEGEVERKIIELYEAINKLNQVEKAVIFLHLEKCSYREIGEITGLTEKNVSVILFRSKEKLRVFFGNHKN